MRDEPIRPPSESAGSAPWWHLPLVVLASLGFESLFVHHGINLTDEGWPLYAAMRLHAGGTLYEDVFFVFPPGHLLAAWIGYALDPPGVIATRWIYAGFNVALCGALYALGRRLMPARFALLGALLVAFAAPRSHNWQLLFGYRYLVLAVLTLLAFSQRLRSGDARWMVVAGACAGLALCFRLTPALAVCCGIGAGILAADGDRRRWLRDGALFGAGVLAILTPVLAWFAHGVGLATLWSEVVARPVEMTALQSRPIPELAWPTRWNRFRVSEAFVPVLFYLTMLLYAGYALLLGGHLLRSLRRRTGFQDTLLLAVAVWGGVYFLRSLGRSDAPHLDSAIPPACLLAARALWAALRRLAPAGGAAGAGRRFAEVAAILAVLGGWVFLLGSDRSLALGRRATAPLVSVGGGRTSLPPQHRFRIIDPKVRSIREWSEPGDVILDLSASPLFYVLAERLGPGFADIVMPATFRDPDEERAFLERVQAARPAVVIMPLEPFDGRPERSVQVVAPLLTRWVMDNYVERDRPVKFVLMVPRS